MHFLGKPQPVEDFKALEEELSLCKKTLFDTKRDRQQYIEEVFFDWNAICVLFIFGCCRINRLKQKLIR